MLLAVDIGNSSTKFGLFEGENLTAKFFIPTKRDHTADQLAREVGDRINSPAEAAIVCSVVPETDAAFSAYLSHFLHVQPRFVKTSDDFRLTFKYSRDGAGTDRLVNSFAATEKYGFPVVIVSFGTATTLDVINSRREHVGGVIAPGMGVTAKALELAASKLPEVEIRMPGRVISTTTETSIQSGIVYGHIAMLEGLLRRVADELNETPKVVATGGFAELIASECNAIELVDPDLTLHGLQMMVKRAVSDRFDGQTPSA